MYELLEIGIIRLESEEEYIGRRLNISPNYGLIYNSIYHLVE